VKVLVAGGIAKSFLNFRRPLLTELVRRGYEVHGCAGEADAQTLEAICAMGVIFHPAAVDRTGSNPLHDLRYFRELVSLMRHIRPAVVMAYTHKPVIFASLAARCCGVTQCFPLITGLGYPFMDPHSLRHRVVQEVVVVLYKAALRGTRTVFFQNSDDPELFRNKGLLTQRNRVVIVAGSGVPLDDYPFCPPSTTPLRFLLMGRLLRDKGIAEYVEAARLLKRRHPDVQVDILGRLDTNSAGLTAEDVRAWSRDGIVNYHEAVVDVRPFIEKASVYVLPSYREGMPRTVLEAMSMGRPIITTAAPGCRETVEEAQPSREAPALLKGTNGFLVPIKDVGALACAMEQFIQNPQWVAPMGLASRRFAEQKFDVRKVNAVLLSEMGL
jgi:glycosyltransferase involved in cell wall biosynthesis